MSEANNDTKLQDVLEKLQQAQRSLEEALRLPVVHDRDRAGIIQSFEFVYELTWKALKRLLAALGHETKSSRDAFKTAFQVGLVAEEEVWIEAIDDRNRTSHTYSRDMAVRLVDKIKTKYVQAFHELTEEITRRAQKLG